MPLLFDWLWQPLAQAALSLPRLGQRMAELHRMWEREDLVRERARAEHRILVWLEPHLVGAPSLRAFSKYEPGNHRIDCAVVGSTVRSAGVAPDCNHQGGGIAGFSKGNMCGPSASSYLLSSCFSPQQRHKTKTYLFMTKTYLSIDR